MIKRIVTALVGVPIAVFLIFCPGGRPFAAAIGVISLLGALEFYVGSRKGGARPVEWAGLLAVAAFVFSAWTYERSTIGSIFPAGLTLLLILSFTVEMIRRDRAPLLNVGTTIFGAIYVGWLISHLVVLRRITGDVSVGSYSPYQLAGKWFDWSDAGAWLVMFTFLCTWACDTSAYFCGRFLGRTKLAPRLSPNKTVEGSLGGFLGSVVCAVGVGVLIHLPLHHSIALGALCGILSQLGDLSESAIKRDLGMKDFGTMVPGHGGILDRFDSLLFTGPAAYYYIVLFLQHWPK